MTEYATQPGLGPLTSSRHDDINDILDGYGNSFEDSESSPYGASPVPSFKELPPPPPPPRARDRKYSNDKPLPAIEKMNMPFQLRVDAPVPDSPNGSIPSEGAPSRIVSKRLKRRSVPRSLTLTKSNGSTAELPSAPVNYYQSEAQITSKEQAEQERSLPPPPPEKSARRQQPSVMGNEGSRIRSPRKDSLHSQDGKEDFMEPVKRKPLPKFTSLAELGKGPRGGKGGPMPQLRSRKPSFEERSEEEDRGRPMVRSAIESTTRENAPPKLREKVSPMAPPRIVNPLPPTPTDEPAAAPRPPTKMHYGGMGLPSNPKHKKGKSSTGFDFMKSAKSPQLQQHQLQQHQLPAPTTITPGSTPTPNSTEEMRQENIVGIVDPPRSFPVISPVSNTPRRPFSFEPPVSTSPPLKEGSSNTSEEQIATAGTSPSPGSTSPPTSTVSPVNDDIAAAAESSQPSPFPPRSALRAPPPPAFASLPSQQRSDMSDGSSDSVPESPTTPFVPLTANPAPRSAAPITDKHYNCYSRHATFIWSRNDFQPMACMICHKNDQERKWACVWCYLRVCVECSVELQKTPGRNLGAVLEKKRVEASYEGDDYDDGEEMHPGFEAGAEAAQVQTNGKRHDSGNPALVVWDADAEDVGDHVDFS